MIKIHVKIQRYEGDEKKQTKYGLVNREGVNILAPVFYYKREVFQAVLKHNAENQKSGPLWVLDLA